MSQPIEHNTPLLVAFDKLRFAPYVVADSCVCVDTGDGTATGGAVTSVIFLTKRHFHQWEAGTELRYTIEMVHNTVNHFIRCMATFIYTLSLY